MDDPREFLTKAVRISNAMGNPISVTEEYKKRFAENGDTFEANTREAMLRVHDLLEDVWNDKHKGDEELEEKIDDLFEMIYT